MSKTRFLGALVLSLLLFLACIACSIVADRSGAVWGALLGFFLSCVALLMMAAIR